MPREVGEDVVYVLPVHQARACVSLLVVVEACLGVTDFAMRNKGVRACSCAERRDKHECHQPEVSRATRNGVADR